MRECYYVNESFAERVDGVIVYHVARITEGKRGYFASVTSTDLEYLQGVVERGNESLGLTRQDVLDIVASSMRGAR